MLGWWWSSPSLQRLECEHKEALENTKYMSPYLDFLERQAGRALGKQEEQAKSKHKASKKMIEAKLNAMEKPVCSLCVGRFVPLAKYFKEGVIDLGRLRRERRTVHLGTRRDPLRPPWSDANHHGVGKVRSAMSCHYNIYTGITDRSICSRVLTSSFGCAVIAIASS